MRTSALVAFAFALVSGVGGAGLFACASESTAPPSCPNDLPSACPSEGAPSYAQTIAPIFASRCQSCHREGGEAGGEKTFDTYKTVFDDRRAILNQVYACSMPPSSDEALSDAERAALLTWFVCGAPNN